MANKALIFEYFDINKTTVYTSSDLIEMQDWELHFHPYA